MSVEEIKSEIENLTTKSISEVIAFAIHVRDLRDSAASAEAKAEYARANAAEEAN